MTVREFARSRSFEVVGKLTYHGEVEGSKYWTDEAGNDYYKDKSGNICIADTEGTVY